MLQYLVASSKVLCSILPTPCCYRDGEERCCRLVVDSHIVVAGKQAVGTVAADIVVADKQVVGTVVEAAGTEVVDIVVADTAAEEQIRQQLREPRWPSKQNSYLGNLVGLLPARHS